MIPLTSSPALSVGQFFDFVTTFSFGFLKILRIKWTSILKLYFFEIFRNQRTCCSRFFFLVNSESKEPLVAGLWKKFKELRGLWNRYQQFRVGSSTGSLDFSESWLLVKNQFFDFLKSSSSSVNWRIPNPKTYPISSFFGKTENSPTLVLLDQKAQEHFLCIFCCRLDECCGSGRPTWWTFASWIWKNISL